MKPQPCFFFFLFFFFLLMDGGRSWRRSFGLWGWSGNKQIAYTDKLTAVISLMNNMEIN